MTRRDALRVTAAALAANQTGAAMTADSDLCFLEAIELARLLKAKKLSARELLDAHLKQIARVNPKVNAIVTLVEDRAREQARQVDEARAKGTPQGPLAGLPIAHKDLNETRGIRTTFGSRIFKDNIPQTDSLIVERIHRAGAVTLGKTNTPEFGAGSQTFNEVFGRTLNPYDLTRTCGGSTGGGAVALACGMIPLADGSDMGGSLRNPASFCNVVGLRPAPGRVPNASKLNLWGAISVDGPMARTVADVAFFLSAIAGPTSRSPISIDQPPQKFAEPLKRDFKGTRVAWFRNLGGVPFDPQTLDVIRAQRRVFENLGCIVEQAEPDFEGADESFKTLRALTSVGAYADHVRTHRDLMKDTIIREVEQGAKLTGPEIARAETLRTRLFERIRVFFEKYDYFVLPVTQLPPFDVTKPYPTEVAGTKMETYIDWMKSCYFISITGCPALSVPAGFTPGGLPVGIQIVGPHRSEWSILQLGHAFEAANGAGKRRPSIAL